VDLYMPTDRATGKPRGFAFVEYSTEAEAEEAIRKFNGREFDGRTLKVNAADERPRARTGPRERQWGPPPDFGGRTAEPSFFPVEGRVSRPKGSRRGTRGRKRSVGY
jgi:RNA recognition motif-containing protein